MIQPGNRARIVANVLTAPAKRFWADSACLRRKAPRGRCSAGWAASASARDSANQVKPTCP
jgi:hypothetical protein